MNEDQPSVNVNLVIQGCQREITQLTVRAIVAEARVAELEATVRELKSEDDRKG